MAFVCSHVFQGVRRALLASSQGGDLQLHCGVSHVDERPQTVALETLLDRDPTLRAIVDLPPNWVAERANTCSPWTRSKSPGA